MKTWPALLASAAEPELVALVATVTSAVNAGIAAEKVLADAEAARDAFRLGGERKKIFDKFNSLCAKTYGALKALVHDHPELGLVSGYAESFFQRGPAARAEAPVTLEDAITEVKSLEEQLKAATAQRDDLQAKETAHAAQLKNAEAAVLEAAALKKKSDEAELSAQAAVQAANELDPTPAGKSKKNKKK